MAAEDESFPRGGIQRKAAAGKSKRKEEEDDLFHVSSGDEATGKQQWNLQMGG